MTDSVDALIVGAGPAGASTGALLAEAGLETIIIDRASFPRDKPCAEYMSPAVLPLLNRLGVMPELIRAGACRLDGTTVVTAHGGRLTGLFNRLGSPRGHHQGLAVSRRVLDAALVAAARAAGAQVLERTRLVEILRHRGCVVGAVVATAGGTTRTIRSRIVVGADGLHSMVARSFGPVRRERLRRWAFVGHFAGVTGLANRAEIHVGPAGYVGLNPIGGGTTNVSLVVGRDRARHANRDLTDFFHKTLHSFPGISQRVTPSGAVAPLRAAGPFASTASNQVVDGGLLVGDAAEFFDPFTGEGIHSALKGGQLASSAIIEALRKPQLVSAHSLRGYLRARRRLFWGKWAVERIIGYGMLMPRVFDRAVERIGRKEPMAHIMIGVTGHLIPPTAVLNPVFLARMIL